MINRIRGALPAALLVLAVAAPPATAAPVSVNLRVEGAARTIFDGPVTTDGHAITTASSGGPHVCDGTNGGASTTPGPVATAALDDGARSNGFSWDADWNSSFSDFLVKQVGGESQTSTQFWGYLVNFAFPSVGGCQRKVNQGDEVVWVFDAFSKTSALKLVAPESATTGAPVTVQVVDGADGSPEAGAIVNGSATGADGRATLSFAAAGIYRLKAERADAVRSNAVALCVDPPGADPCSSADKLAPKLDVTLPGKRLASERGRSRTMLVSWQADDGEGAGVSHYSVEVREVASGVNAAKLEPGPWRTLAPRTTLPRAHFRGGSGKAYQFRIGAVDRAANRTAVETDPIVLPVDDRDRDLWRFSRGWKRLRRETAWGRTVMTTERAGASAKLRFEGRSVALIGRRLARGGRLRVSLDGKSRTLRLRGRSGPRTVLWQGTRRADGEHVLRIRSLGGGPVLVDAVAPQP
jgi:hypothetical protein